MKDIYRRGKQKEVYVETISVDEKVLGQWKNWIISMVDDSRSLRFRIKGTGGQTIESFSWHEPLNGLFTVDEYVVLEQADRNGFFFWNLTEKRKKQVFRHEVKGGILCVDKDIQDKLRPTETCGKLKHIADDGNLPIKAPGKQLKGTNFAPLIIAIVLSLLGVYFTYAAAADGIITLADGVYARELIRKLVCPVYLLCFLTMLRVLFAKGMFGFLRRCFPMLWFLFSCIFCLQNGIKGLPLGGLKDSISYNFFTLYSVIAIPFYVASLRYRSTSGIWNSISSTAGLAQALFMELAGYMVFLTSGGSLGGFCLYTFVVFGIYTSFAPEKIKKTLKPAVLACIGAVAAFMYNYDHFSQYSNRLQRFMEWKYGETTRNLRYVIDTSPFVGASSTEVSIKPYSAYCKDYTLNYVIGNYGLAWGLLIVILFALLSYFLLWGVKRCSDEGDRLVCLGCSIYLITQMFFYVSNNCALLPFLGMPVPFFDMGSLGSTASWMALAVYMAYYKAHKEVYLK